MKNSTSITSESEALEKSELKLSSKGVAEAVSKRILEDIDRYCVDSYNDGHRAHLGASLIGDECSRKLWYGFRWVQRPSFTGRVLRLFNRGHREEDRFIEWLEGVGFKIFYEDRSNLYYHPALEEYCIKKENELLSGEWACVTPEYFSNYREHLIFAKLQGIEFPQYRISACEGHFGGSMDGWGYLPEHYGIKEAVLFEFKTNGTGVGFNDLGKKGMAVAKPQHFAQTSTYGRDPKYNFKYVVYMNINKNDDSLHVEVVKLNHKLGEQMIEKADRIITSNEPPERLSNNPTFMKCGYCDYKDICHKGALIEKNCRSCKYAKPVQNAEWQCTQFNGIIPKDFIKTGCDSYVQIASVSE